MMGVGSFRNPPKPANAETGPTFLEVMRRDSLAFSDALTMARLTGVMRENRKMTPDIRRGTAFTLTDLRKGPMILVGAYNNPWTLRLQSQLRFTFEWTKPGRSASFTTARIPPKPIGLTIPVSCIPSSCRTTRSSRATPIRSPRRWW
ncbi:MAG: hypothetical protein WDO73_36840 [Ignavibacteriota bacterium]